MSAAEAFVPLADLLRPAVVHETAVEGTCPQADEPVVVAAAAPVAPETVAAIREARLFRARLADALDARLARLLAAIASEIVVRDVQIAPANLAALVARIVDEQVAAPQSVRVSPADRNALAGCDLDVIEDDSLAAGDAVVAFLAGEIDARLGVRLAAVLEALR